MPRIQPETLRFLVLLAVSGAVSAGASDGGGRIAGEGPRVAGLTCAPFARELSGMALYGDAAEWWGEAAGRYQRGSRPEPGGILVFRRSGRLPEGHVSVVSRVLDARRIQVTQANWVPEELDQDQLVVDVSPENDWSAVRVWYPPVAALGSFAYATFGFIEPPFIASHDALARAVRPAAYYAVSAHGRAAPRARSIGG
jgi:surface antigen